MSRRLVAALAATVSLVAVAVSGGASVQTSSATYTSSSRSTATVRAAADWTPPTVSLHAPAAAVFGTVTLVAEAADAETAVASVAVQQRPAGATAWGSVCTTTTSPLRCAWDTTVVADGAVELRAVATDRTGLSRTSAPVTTTVANAVAVTLGDPGDNVRGTVPLTATLHGAAAGTGTWAVRFEYAVADDTAWKPLCTDATAPYTCSWATTAVPSQEYDLRAVAVSGTATHLSPVVAEVLVDNAAPTVTLANPGSPLRGTVTFVADADDEHSGLDQVVVQYAATGSAYRELCTVTEEPFSCAYRTTQLLDGTYAFRAVATDLAGNAASSAAVLNRVVDNTMASVSVDDPGSHLRGEVTVAASAASAAGISAVRLQRTASGTWTDLCTDTTAPYSCTWDTTTVADGSYDLRAILVDAQGRVTTSATLRARQVDNSPLRAVDVQTANGGVSGRLDPGDTVTFTYNQRLDPGSVLSGWTGEPVPVTVRLRDGRLVGSINKDDRLDVQRNGATLPLGTVALRQNHVGVRRTATFAATMTASTTTVDGVEATAVTIHVGVPTSGVTRKVPSAATMVWTPSAGVVDTAGQAGSTAPVAESGPFDREF